MAPSAAIAGHGDHPAPDDGDRAVQLVEALVSPNDAVLCARALEVIRASTRTLAEKTGGFGLIHGDLHYENVLFRAGEAQAIDFDDCGWGFHLYDLAVTLSELEARPRYEELRDALLDAYAQIRRLPEDHAIHLRALFVLRRMQILMWVLQSRDHATFREMWKVWARTELDAIATMLDGQQPMRSVRRSGLSIDDQPMRGEPRP
jgi:Ser/Thr protein kinase RdoA (MazF antagonist)